MPRHSLGAQGIIWLAGSVVTAAVLALQRKSAGPLLGSLIGFVIGIALRRYEVKSSATRSCYAALIWSHFLPGSVILVWFISSSAAATLALVEVSMLAGINLTRAGMAAPLLTAGNACPSGPYRVLGSALSCAGVALFMLWICSGRSAPLLACSVLCTSLAVVVWSVGVRRYSWGILGSSSWLGALFSYLASGSFQGMTAVLYVMGWVGVLGPMSGRGNRGGESNCAERESRA
jgi:hypothetical protein